MNIHFSPPSRPHSGGRPRAGLTLAETLVTAAIFTLLTMLAAQVQRTGASWYAMHAQRDDAQTQAMLAFAQIRGELQDARAQVDGQSLYLALPQSNNDVVLVDAQGLPQFGPYALCYWMDGQGHLIRSGPQGDRPVARLGSQGRVTFSLDTLGTSPPGSTGLLKVTVIASQDNSAARQVTGYLYLRHQP